MKLPAEIKTKHKIRDLAILKMFVKDNMTQTAIASRFNLTVSRVNQIVSANNHLITWEKNQEKAVRINTLKKMLNKHPENIGKKSTLDIVEQLRKEIEGDKPLIDQSQHTYLTKVEVKIAGENAEIQSAPP